MKRQSLMIFLFGSIFFACHNHTKNNGDTRLPTSNESAKQTNSKPLNSPTEVEVKNDNKAKSQEDWQRSQDSIRSIILSAKENKILKTSILQEAYIKNIVWPKNDTLFFLIPFDLHGFDCIAPDCYSTDLIFNFKFKDSLLFPNKLPFTIHEHGCVDKEINSSGVFYLIESDKNFITYHSKLNKSTLIIFKSDDRRETIYYFVGVGPNTIKGKLVHKIIDAYDEENPKSIVPYRSTIMSNSEYEFLLKNNSN